MGYRRAMSQSKFRLAPLHVTSRDIDDFATSLCANLAKMAMGHVIALVFTLNIERLK